MKDIENLDKHWHLAKTDHEIAVTELEYAQIRVSEALARWESECLAAVLGKVLSGHDVALLHVIRMKDRAKGVTEIARLLNRDDIANIQYSIRKLSNLGLVQKSGRDGRKTVRYCTTEKGMKASEDYAKLRRHLLFSLTRAMGNWEEKLTEAAKVLDLMTGIYDQAARVAATHRRSEDGE